MKKAVYPGLYPGVIKSYAPPSRQVRVSVAEITGGGDEYPIAEIKYPIGDKSKNTEIEISAGDAVWVQFICGDSRFPVIDGYRNPESGNGIGVRYLHHSNITLSADDVLDLSATTIRLHGDVQISGGALTHEGKNVGADHTHSGVDAGPGNTGAPN